VKPNASQFRLATDPRPDVIESDEMALAFIAARQHPWAAFRAWQTVQQLRNWRREIDSSAARFRVGEGEEAIVAVNKAPLERQDFALSAPR
jgi:hypothetical protein